jgi:ATP-binding cassette subfamily F protein uup
VDDYLSIRLSMRAGRDTPVGAATAGTGDTRASRKELARIERRLERISALEAKLHAEIAAHATDHERVLALDGELHGLADERAELEDEWLSVADDVS